MEESWLNSTDEFEEVEPSLEEQLLQDEEQSSTITTMRIPTLIGGQVTPSYRGRGISSGRGISREKDPTPNPHGDANWTSNLLLQRETTGYNSSSSQDRMSYNNTVHQGSSQQYSDGNIDNNTDLLENLEQYSDSGEENLGQQFARKVAINTIDLVNLQSERFVTPQPRTSNNSWDFEAPSEATVSGSSHRRKCKVSRKRVRAQRYAPAQYSSSNCGSESSWNGKHPKYHEASILEPVPTPSNFKIPPLAPYSVYGYHTPHYNFNYSNQPQPGYYGPSQLQYFGYADHTPCFPTQVPFYQQPVNFPFNPCTYNALPSSFDFGHPRFGCPQSHSQVESPTFSFPNIQTTPCSSENSGHYTPVAFTTTPSPERDIPNWFNIPNWKVAYNAPVLCNICSIEGHFSRDCRSTTGGRMLKRDIYTTSKGVVICFTCGKPGHKHYVHNNQLY